MPSVASVPAAWDRRSPERLFGASGREGRQSPFVAGCRCPAPRAGLPAGGEMQPLGRAAIPGAVHATDRICQGRRREALPIVAACVKWIPRSGDSWLPLPFPGDERGRNAALYCHPGNLAFRTGDSPAEAQGRREEGGRSRGSPLLLSCIFSAPPRLGGKSFLGCP